ncbi:synaptophysin-like protein 2 isoform X2 [Artemia franciscana]|uniref:synaptophysin-like protein 2 isoform X2 n=1 Tax=Artemia franciscana TaxID=6661 RepID=UPI0032DA71D9
MELDLDILKIPRGFIRILQFVFAVFAFACLTSFSTVIEFMVKCKDNGSETVHPVSIVYPFRLDHIHTAQACKDAFTYDYSGDFSSDAQFFVATGVLSMLYALGSLAFYLMCDDVYTNNKIYPLILLGFLNFFLWASNLWFVYKETAWFQPRAPPPGVTIQTPVA